MGKLKSFSEKTSASGTVVGFDYQYYYFLFMVLNLKKGQSVGLEVLDDVHTTLENNFQILIQVKHTIQNDKSGKSISLTRYDKDLWKTLSNWKNIVTDKKDGRADFKSQKSFIQKTTFLLVSNKSQFKSSQIEELFDNTSNKKLLLKKLEAGTADSDIKGYISDLSDLNEELLKDFISKVQFELEMDSIIEKCKISIEEKNYETTHVDQVFRDLDSLIREDNFIEIKNGGNVIISFELFQKKYRRFFDLARNPELRVRRYYDKLPEKIESQTFIQQLVGIGDVKATNIGEITEYTRYMLTAKTNIIIWQNEGELTSEELENLKTNAMLKWKNTFKKHHNTKEGDDKMKASNVLYEIRDHLLSIGQQPLDMVFSNGKYYLLSDIPEIGWLSNWESKYK